MEKKVFVVEGYAKKGSLKFRFKKYFIALKKEDAIFYTYSILGSNHKLKKTQIHIERVYELDPEKDKDKLPDKRLLAFF
ncbi:NEQ346 [Nanoarchaeum equitans Kin4-M]|uniref:Large ribosomal subunit protein eL20 n=1 Tax=Nanoarchaeum equitans (strain Kin4-M) TaxID=228908 RepID=RL18A_NANEQ|nr:RecName: Full=Large ribosomal subunit protein eL20; AltName: Full=50S ribosomal protein L18Ae; AltName: Full=50S ribosomal protein L20e; AltName: Full=50S ribosomal protein LX [Nanoarchaeum equitans Kin4-M]AAR39195.1 NEQ346 [Nanoarchaeum equitans Kin4-M]